MTHAPLEVADLSHLNGTARDISHDTSDKQVTREDLLLLSTPEATDTFSPISHYDFVTLIVEVAMRMLTGAGYTLMDLSLRINHTGLRLFGYATFQQEETDLRLAVGFRQGLDKSMSAGVAIGGQVVVCSNLCFSGQEVLLRMHRGDVIAALRRKIMDCLFDAPDHFRSLQHDVAAMRSGWITDKDAYQAMGLMFGQKVLMPTQLTKVRTEWLEPSHDHDRGDRDRSIWSLYNAVTEVYKELPVAQSLKKHHALHRFFQEEFLV
jgi:hypothetical protein